MIASLDIKGQIVRSESIVLAIAPQPRTDCAKTQGFAYATSITAVGNAKSTQDLGSPAPQVAPVTDCVTTRKVSAHVLRTMSDLTAQFTREARRQE